MGNKDTMKRFIGGLMIGALLLGGGGLALAATTDDSASVSSNSTSTIGGPRMPGMLGMNSEQLQSILGSLVSANTITQEQADQIMAKQKQLIADRQTMREQMKNIIGNMKNMTQAERQAARDQTKPERVDIFTQLVNDGTITQAQVDSIRAAFQDKMAAERQEQLGTALNGLVDKNVINSEQSAAILKKLTEIHTERQAQMEATKDMTKEQRQAYFGANRPGKENPLAELVTSGTLTQAQADQVAQSIPLGGKGMGMHEGRGNGAGGPGKCGQVNSNK